MEPKVVMNGKDVTYRMLTIDDIIWWCKENGQVAWLKAKVKETKVKGDKERKITFIEIKRDFVDELCLELRPDKTHQMTMLEKIELL